MTSVLALPSSTRSTPTAVASLENEEPLLEISGLQIESGRDDLGSQRALLTVSNYVKQ